MHRIALIPKTASNFGAFFGVAVAFSMTAGIVTAVKREKLFNNNRRLERQGGRCLEEA